MVTICQNQMEWESLRDYASNATQFCEYYNFLEKTDLRAKGASGPNSKKAEEQQNKKWQMFSDDIALLDSETFSTHSLSLVQLVFVMWPQI